VNFRRGDMHKIYRNMSFIKKCWSLTWMIIIYLVQHALRCISSKIHTILNIMSIKDISQRLTWSGGIWRVKQWFTLKIAGTHSVMISFPYPTDSSWLKIIKIQLLLVQSLFYFITPIGATSLRLCETYIDKETSEDMLRKLLDIKRLWASQTQNGKV